MKKELASGEIDPDDHEDGNDSVTVPKAPAVNPIGTSEKQAEKDTEDSKDIEVRRSEKAPEARKN